MFVPLPEILLAASPTVGVRIGASFVKTADGQVVLASPIADNDFNSTRVPSTEFTEMQIRCPNCHESTEVDDSTELSALACASCGSHFSLVGEETLTYTEGETKTFGHFELLDQVGLGAFGAVWRARDTQLDRSVAIKIPRKRTAERETQSDGLRCRQGNR